MSTKKILLLASMALGMVAFALPASAIAVEDTVKDNKVTLADKSISFEGEVEFTSLGSGIKCNTKTTITVNGAEIKVTGFAIVGAVSLCTYSGVYKDCVLKAPMVADDLPFIVVDVQTDPGGSHTFTITSGSKDGFHDTDTGELEKRAGAPGPCNITTNDYTFVHEEVSPGPPPVFVGITLDVETTSGFISGLKYTGSVRVDRGAPGEGTKTPSSVTNLQVSIAGTQKIEKAGENTYNIE
jgi:hypothetical protein